MNAHHRKTPTAKLLKRLIKSYLPPYKKLLAVAWFFMIMDALFTGMMAKFMEPVINNIFVQHDAHLLKWIGFGILTIFTLKGFSTYAHNVLMNKIGQRIVATIQKDLFAHLIRADLSFHHRTSSGKLVANLINDVNLMRDSVAECLTAVGKNSFTLIFLIAVMFYQDAKLALIAFIVFPAAGIFVAFLSKKLRSVSASTQAEIGSFSSVLTQCFQNIRHIKAYNKENYEIGRVGKIIERIYHLTHKAFRVSAFSHPMGEMLSGLAIVTVVTYGGAQVIAGTSTAGALFSFITAFLLAYEPMKRLARLNGRLQAGLAGADRIFEMLELRPKITNIKGAKKLKISEAAIQIENISFSYHTNKKQNCAALRSVSLDISGGETIALVGPSGAGKSTLLNLIPRFYDLDEGRILIDGQDIKKVTLESLRDSIALVSQEIALFDETIFANIAYGCKGKPTLSAVKEAAKAAAADKFIEAFPEGYNTQIGEHGVKLSGGQRQRIAIARAMLKNAPILLLDEATSALDTESERAVQKALKKLQKGRTSIVIAHRLSTIIDADQIYVMENGMIKDHGTHKELMEKSKLYQTLHGAIAKEERA